MTCVIGLEYGHKVYIGADSITMSGWEKNVLTFPKVFRVGAFLMGHAGAVRMQNILVHHVIPRAQESDESDAHYLVAGLIVAVREAMKEQGYVTTQEGRETSGNDAFLVGFHSRLYWVGSDFDVSHFADGMAAIGTGADYALGSLYTQRSRRNMKIDPEQVILRALAVSGKFCAAVCPPYYVESI